MKTAVLLMLIIVVISAQTTTGGLTALSGSVWDVSAGVFKAAGITAGTNGQDTPSVFYGKVGTYSANPGDGTGILGIGASAMKGVGLWLDTGISTFTTGEVLGANFAVTHSPASSVTFGTGAFALTTVAKWQGSADSSAFGQVYGGQLTAQWAGGSLLHAYGLESVVQGLAAGTTLVQATGNWAHIDNQNTGTMLTAEGLLASVGGGNVTTAIGVHVGTVTGVTNAYGIKINDVTGASTLNYALHTGSGAVHFGGAVDAPSATIPILYGLVSIGDGTTSAARLTVNGKTGQGPNLLNLSVAGVIKFSVDANGSMSFINDVSFNSSTAIFGAGYDVMVSSGLGISMQSAKKIAWSGTTHAYDALDTSLSRGAAGVLYFGTGAAGSAAGSWQATNGTLSGILTLSTLTTPADNATCTAGTIWVDTGFIYVCAVSGTVKRVALATY